MNWLAAVVVSISLFAVDMPTAQAPSGPLEASLSDYSCLGNALYMESRGEPLKGSKAVYDVIVNRAHSTGKSLCDVIWAKGQFQWTKKHVMLPEHKWVSLYQQVMSQPKVLDNKHKWFYNPSLAKPVWAKKMKCKMVGRHNFCKEKQL